MCECGYMFCSCYMSEEEFNQAYEEWLKDKDKI